MNVFIYGFRSIIMAGDIILDGREWNRSFTLSLKKMREAGLLCDAAIICVDSDDSSTIPILVHACVLAASSPTLKNSILKQAPDKDTGIKHVDSMGFGDRIWNFLLEFMYTSRVVIPANQRHYLQEIEDAAMTLSVKDLIDAVTLAQTKEAELIDLGGESAEDVPPDTPEVVENNEHTETTQDSPTKKSKRLALKRNNPRRADSAKRKRRKMDDYDEDVDYQPPYLKNGEHVCEICNGVFKNRRPLQQHMNLFHPEHKRHFCKTCAAPFNSPIALADHMRKEHKAKLLECIICYKEFYTRDAWRRHMRLYHPNADDTEPTLVVSDRAIKVEEVVDSSTIQPLLSVGEELTEEQEQEQPKEDERGLETVYASIEVYEGDMAEETTAAEITEEQVNDTTGEVDAMPDTAAELTASQKDDLTGEWTLGKGDEAADMQNVNVVDDTPKPNNVRVSGRLRRGRPKKIKLEVEKEEGQYKCSVCPKLFVTINGLTAHQQKRHPDVYRGKHVCTICDRTFGQLGDWEDHQRIKHDAEPLQCEMCDKTFLTRDAMYRHERFKHHLKGRRAMKKQRKILCTDCGETFQQTSALEDHQREKHEAPPLICETCGMDFTQKAQMYRHTRYMHGEKGKDVLNVMAVQNLTEEEKAQNQEANEWKKKNLSKFQCETCDYVAGSRIMLEEHQKKHSDVKEYKCELCQKEFKYKVGLINHTAKHHPESANLTFSCIQCPEKFGRQVFLDDHMRKMHNAPLLECDHCDKKHVTYDSMYRHKRYEHPNLVKQKITKLLKCDKCNYQTLNKGAMKSHELRHTNVRAFVCETCGMDFKFKGDLKKHNQQRHMPDYVPPVYHCEVCNLECKNKAILERHYVSRHQKEFTRIFPCEKCNKEFGSKTNRDDHVRFDHMGEKIQCQFCPAQFNHVNVWYEHRQKEHPDLASRVTLSDDLFACGICHKQFRKIPLLRRHERYHVTYRPYKCEKCGCSFVAKEDLKAHFKVHNGEKSFKCPHCPFTTLRKPALTTHLRKHDESQHLHCPHCERTYVVPMSLRKHLRQAHNIQRAEEDRILDSMQQQQTVYLKIEQESCTEDPEAEQIVITPSGEKYHLQEISTVMPDANAEIPTPVISTPQIQELVSDRVTFVQAEQQIIQEQQEFILADNEGTHEEEHQQLIVNEEHQMIANQPQMIINEPQVIIKDSQQRVIISEGQEFVQEFQSIEAGVEDEMMLGAGGEGEEVLYIMTDEGEEVSRQIVPGRDENGQEVMYMKLGENEFVPLQLVDPDSLP